MRNGQCDGGGADEVSGGGIDVGGGGGGSVSRWQQDSAQRKERQRQRRDARGEGLKVGGGGGGAEGQGHGDDVQVVDVKMLDFSPVGRGGGEVSGKWQLRADSPAQRMHVNGKGGGGWERGAGAEALDAGTDGLHAEFQRVQQRAELAERRLQTLESERRFQVMESEAVVDLAARQQEVGDAERAGLLARIRELEEQLASSASMSESMHARNGGVRYLGQTPSPHGTDASWSPDKRQAADTLDLSLRSSLASSSKYGRKQGSTDGRAGWLKAPAQPKIAAASPKWGVNEWASSVKVEQTLKSLRAENARLSKETAEQQRRATAAQARVDALQMQLEVQQEAAREHAQKLQLRLSDSGAAYSEKSKRESELSANLHRRVRHLETENEELAAAIEAERTTSRDAKEEAAAVQDDLRSLQQALSLAQQEVGNLTEAREAREEAEATLQSALAEQARAAKRVEEAEARVEAGEEEVRQWRARAAKAEEEAEVLRGKGRETASALSAAEERVRELESALQVSRDRVREFDGELAESRESLRRAHSATDHVEEEKQEALSAAEAKAQRIADLEGDLKEEAEARRKVLADLSAAEEAIRQLDSRLREAEERSDALAKLNDDKDLQILDLTSKVQHFQGTTQTQELAKETAERALGEFARQSTAQLQQLAHWQRTAADLRHELQDKEAEMHMLTIAREKASRAVAATQQGALDAMRDNQRLKADLELASQQLHEQRSLQHGTDRNHEAELLEKERVIRLLRDEMHQVEQLLQAELALRNDALAAARSESGRVKESLQVRAREKGEGGGKGKTVSQQERGRERERERGRKSGRATEEAFRWIIRATSKQWLIV